MSISSGIQALPVDVIASIRSSYAIRSMADVILGLLQNSLDANAVHVHALVDLRKGFCELEDNGRGIPAEEFQEGGCLGLPFHTSKYYGHEKKKLNLGSFISNLSALSSVTIVSRQSENVPWGMLHLRKSARRSSNFPCTTNVPISLSGTRITVHGLFESMPVRVKQRSEQDEISRSREWNTLVKDTVSLLLASCCYPQLRFVDIAGEQHTFVCSPKLDFNVLCNNFDYVQDWSCFARRLLTQTSLVDFRYHDSWTSVSACNSALSIEGTILLHPLPLPDLQFISLGFEPLYRQGFASKFYETANRLFQLSSFRSNADTLDANVRSNQNLKIRDIKLENSTKSVAAASTRQLNRWPAFAFRMEIRPAQSDQVIPHADLTNIALQDAILDLLQRVISSWLQKYEFQAKKASTSTNSWKSGTNHISHGSYYHSYQSAKTAIECDLAIPVRTFSMSNLSRMKGTCLRDANNQRQEKAKSKLRDMSSNLLPRALLWEAKTQSTVNAESRSGQHISNLEQSEDDAYEEFVLWHSSLLGASHVIDSRSGATIHPHKDKEPTLTMNWENPTFAVLEESISCIVHEDIAKSTRRPSVGLGHLHYIANTYLQCIDKYDNFTSRITPKHLAISRVISQLDQKFILIHMRLPHDRNFEDSSFSGLRSGDETALVIIDQHAADERALLEDLFRSLCLPNHIGHTKGSKGLAECVVNTLDLKEPISFEVGPEDISKFRQLTPLCKKWGIVYDILSNQNVGYSEQNYQSIPAASATVNVRSLPPSIAKRCISDPSLLLILLRSVAWTSPGIRSKGTSRPQYTDGDMGHFSWLKMIGDCPSGIIDMLVSRACRSAIMFNDSLTLAESQQLVARLSRCAFPFRCAHGRPSMQPLVMIGDSKNLFSKTLSPADTPNAFCDATSANFVAKYKAWRALELHEY